MELKWYCRYFDVPLTGGVMAQFRQNRVTRALYIFTRAMPHGNAWHERGYGWGVWRRIR